VLICRPGDPEAKGLVERLHDYLERSFLPGRTFASPADFNMQLQRFLARANTRQHRRLGCRPADRIDADGAAMALFLDSRGRDGSRGRRGVQASGVRFRRGRAWPGAPRPAPDHLPVELGREAAKEPAIADRLPVVPA
jgi:transposase